jgi:hypothetical protein
MWRWLKPNTAGTFLWLLFIGVQLLCGREADLALTQGLVTEAPTTWGTSFGFPVMFEAAGGPEIDTIVKVRWMTLAGVLAGTWASAMVLGRLMTDAGVDPRRGPVLRPRRHPAIVLLACVLTMVPIAFAGAAVVSKWLFGYWTEPPAQDTRLREASSIRSVTPIFIESTAPGGVIVKARREGDQQHNSARLADLDIPASAWQTIPDDGPGKMSIDQLDILSRVLNREGVFLDRHGTATLLSGHAIEFADARGDEFAVVSVQSGPVTDDMFLRFECVLTRPQIATPRLISTRQFYVGRGWLAPLRWSVLFRLLLVVLVLFVVPAASACLVFRRLVDRWRIPHGFPVIPVAGTAK